MAQPTLIEPTHVPDVFCSGIARIERIGGDCVRLVVYVETTNDRATWTVVARLIWPITALRAARRVLAKMPDGK